ncbi:MAG: hypothetical protein GWN84_20485 [Gammaproteobacteria bacterium]|nr:hypothetical protein [Gammaproteobacteria bacterium]NIR85139.1 hypothetical protein [Gammaproteobacteria bacterium]NIU06188.1 hypothetical protein [Gammaproteobacteria bacterium]NIX87461.1 hypothetical protein [Gammaproteobacteria bacterium]
MPPVQTTYNTTPPSKAAGHVADLFGPPQFLGDHVLATRQLENIINTGQDGTYTITIDGVEVANFVASTNTATQIRDGLKSDLDAAGIVNEAVSTDQLNIEAPGDDADDGFTIAISTVTGYALTNLVEHGQEVPFGLGLVNDDQAPSGQKKCRLPRLATDVTSGLFLGIAAKNVAREPNANGWAHQSLPDVLRMGHIYVVAEGTGTKGAPLYCRHAKNGTGKDQLGAFRVDDDSSNAVAVPGLRALEAWSAAGPVLAEYFPQT